MSGGGATAFPGQPVIAAEFERDMFSVHTSPDDTTRSVDSFPAWPCRTLGESASRKPRAAFGITHP